MAHSTETLAVLLSRRGPLNARAWALRRQQDELDAVQAALDAQIAAAVAPEGVQAKHLLLWRGWECPDSPLGECVYDTSSYKSLDDCLFCHEPQERK